MNLTPFNLSRFNRSQKTRPSAFTLVEVMIALTIMLMTLVGVLAVQFYGMKLFELTKSKLGASDDARKAIDLLCTEIRSAKIIKIGNGGLGATNFTECADNTPQQGSAIQIYATTNTNTFVRYYWDSTTNQLQRTFNGIITKTVVASYITNSGIFTAEDAFGNTNTLKTANHVISMKLQFYQIQYPIIQIGPGNYYDFYQLSTKISKRT
ncbi:MAG TPA: prepilin-type N-terminal cleavage/methylation domain-containing protein [Verrucomicrobiae bacterium]|nr:prepilin-type N-terminal cleavage/methylation domain-containing protein [Verrucomicrobiae bacterium]